MPRQLALAEDEMAILTWLASRGIANSLSGLSHMVGKELTVNGLNIKHLPAKDTVSLLGEPEHTVVGIYLTIHGDATGHIMLVHDPRVAFELIDYQMGLAPGSTRNFGEMERSVLGEMGNITGAFFLNALADATNLVLIPSPPDVMVDMAGTILDVALAKIMQDQEDVLTIKATFGTDTRQIDGTFLVMPTMDFMRVVLRHAGM